MKYKAIALALLAAICTGALASGAPWYKWRNKLDRTILCAKISPGDAWEVVDGPYMESRCRKPGNPQ
ncbi:MAG: hypothetical protein JO269_04395 [Burkholderiaceae bacterium]|nr:hypothetical protein [Burkholderiaceae bacterium]